MILPLLRPALVYGTGVALLLGLGQFTAPLLLGRTENISVLTTEMYFATAQIEPPYGVAAALGSPLLVFGIIVLFVNRVLLGDPSPVRDPRREGRLPADGAAGRGSARRRSSSTPSPRSSCRSARW